MNKRKTSERDLIRSALYDAIGWQLGLADAHAHIDDSQERKRALSLAASYRALLRERYQVEETMEERLDRTSTPISLHDIQADAGR